MHAAKFEIITHSIFSASCCFSFILHASISTLNFFLIQNISHSQNELTEKLISYHSTYEEKNLFNGFLELQPIGKTSHFKIQNQRIATIAKKICHIKAGRAIFPVQYDPQGLPIPQVDRPFHQISQNKSQRKFQVPSLWLSFFDQIGIMFI